MSLDFASGTMAAITLAPHVAAAVEKARTDFNSGRISSVSVTPTLGNQISQAQRKERAAQADELFSGAAKQEAIQVSLVSPADEANQNPKVSAKAQQVMQVQGWKSPSAKAANNVGNNRSKEDQASILGSGLMKHVHIDPQQAKIVARGAKHVSKGHAPAGQHGHASAVGKAVQSKGGHSR
ncbi:MAG: hypothetical protein FJX23_07405 [Alphaproteobacteria bacterium]|nr:hypothetical protein [Alphaproteobacteria bacterium]